MSQLPAATGKQIGGATGRKTAVITGGCGAIGFAVATLPV